MAHVGVLVFNSIATFPPCPFSLGEGGGGWLQQQATCRLLTVESRLIIGYS